MQVSYVLCTSSLTHRKLISFSVFRCKKNLLLKMSELLLSGKQPNTVSKKRKLHSFCLLCTEECQEECKSNLDGWNNLEKSRNWCGLDTFGDAFDSVNQENGPEGMYLHSNCKMKLFNKRSLEQARKRRSEHKEKKKKTKMMIKIENNSTSIINWKSGIVDRRSSGLVYET